MKQIAKLISILTVLILISGAVFVAAKTDKTDTNNISTIQNNASSDTNIGPSSMYSKPPLYLFVGNPTVASWCPDAVDYTICDGEDFNDYITLVVRVTDINFKNWKGVPVTVTLTDDMKQTVKTNSNGEAIFVFDGTGSINYEITIHVEATSPKSGRTVVYTRVYKYDFVTPMDAL